MSNQLPKERCPVCGHRFDYPDLTDKKSYPFYCDRCNERIDSRDQLITEDDDYAWCV